MSLLAPNVAGFEPHPNDAFIGKLCRYKQKGFDETPFLIMCRTGTPFGFPGYRVLTFDGRSWDNFSFTVDSIEEVPLGA